MKATYRRAQILGVRVDLLESLHDGKCAYLLEVRWRNGPMSLQKYVTAKIYSDPVRWEHTNRELFASLLL